MKLIIEQTTDNIQCLTEQDEKTKEKNYLVQGVFMQADQQNKNGRVYPLEIVQREIKVYNDNFVKQNRAMGELGHPETAHVQLDRVSHLIKELSMDGNNVYGKAKLLDTPFGKIAKNFIDEGIKLGMSSRGLGSLKDSENGVKEVQDDFILQSIDIVADPSAPEAFIEGIMENREWIYENGIIQSKEIEEYKSIIKKAHRKDVEAKILKVFEAFVKKL
jgi:hypothetical protein